jgi:DNA modification methylase
MRRAVTAVADADALVLDPFMGSGTTGVACLQTGRRFLFSVFSFFVFITVYF